jgi:hypothetical protein
MYHLKYVSATDNSVTALLHEGLVLLGHVKEGVVSTVIKWILLLNTLLEEAEHLCTSPHTRSRCCTFATILALLLYH